MGVGLWTRRGVGFAVLAAALAGVAAGQSSVAITEPGAPLLPQNFGEWKHAEPAAPATPSYSLSTVSKEALEECGPERSQVADYQKLDGRLHVEAIEFGDRTGAYSAYTLIRRVGMVEGKDLGSNDSVGDGTVLFTVGSTVVLASPVMQLRKLGTKDTAFISELKPLAAVLPKVTGSKGLAPLLPTELPEKGLVPGSVRYALGAATYAAEGGVLPARSLGWEKSAEAVTAQYDDKRGKETLTLLLYPTPTIAEGFARSVQSYAGPYSGTKGGKVRREMELVMLAQGTFPPDVAQRMLENIHLKQQLSIDRDMPPVFQVEVKKTASLLVNIAVLSGVLMLAAVLLGVFLGGGRAAIRVMRGKSAAVEPEFLSLHLDPQNAPPKLEGKPDLNEQF